MARSPTRHPVDTLADRVDDADHLVPERHAEPDAIGIGVVVMEIGAAETARLDAQPHLARRAARAARPSPRASRPRPR